VTEITDDMREKMHAIQGNLSHVRSGSANTWYLQDGEWVKKKPVVRAGNSMFPYKSTAMAVDPSEVPEVREQLRKEGLFVDFDEEGRPEITSTKQQDALAKAMGMKTGRDGYGHTDEYGNFQHSGRRRNDEIQEGRAKVRKAREELNSMPEDVPEGAILDALGKYDICPNEENTG
jgi:hypothetical protein